MTFDRSLRSLALLCLLLAWPASGLAQEATLSGSVIGGAPWSGTVGNESAFGPNAGETEVLIPAGYVQTVYDASFALSTDKKDYVSVNNTTPTAVPAPGMPFSLVFRAEPGHEDVILKVASAYEAASKRRVSPPQFPPLPAKPVNRTASR